jgi:methylthioribose-1-phosphate isomerase
VLKVGECRVAPKGSRDLNPAFDITPSRYVKGFITEKGIFRPGEFGELRG